jgi:hypothetical protein
MKKFLEISFLFIAILFSAALKGQEKNVSLLEKTQAFTAQQDDIVVMDKYTFAGYVYTSEKYDTLKTEVLQYDSVVQLQKAQYDSMQTEYDNVLTLKDSEIKTYSEGYEKMKGIARDEIQAKEKLQVDYLKLSEKHSKAKRWRNLFMGASALLSGFIVLSIAH